MRRQARFPMLAHIAKGGRSHEMTIMMMGLGDDRKVKPVSVWVEQAACNGCFYCYWRLSYCNRIVIRILWPPSTPG